ncbi:MAG TPA: hypothetical protein VFJ43_04225, partial [Bacteroidia bacterium]|nr:hypothetical protein [Bacteroidia bacterium]
VFEKFIATLQIIVNRTPLYLTKSIEEYPYHKSHMGLFITFLELFAYAQKHANGITERHLNFFYQEVLQLAPKKAVADKVHVIFELAKNATEKYKVPENTMLRAGKDGKGVDLVYGTDEDIVVNKASVALFKNLLIDKYTYSGNGTQPFTDATTTTAIFASPIANSTDGVGLALDKTVPQWNAFGSSQQGKTRVNHTMPDGHVGFAISSPQLFLSEGLRTVHVLITFTDKLDFTDTGIHPEDITNTKYYNCVLTTAKEWMKPTSTKIIYTEANKTLEFIFTITEKQAAIVAHDPKVHLGTFNTPNPVVKIELLNFVHPKLVAPYKSSYFKNLYPVLGTAIFNRLDINVRAEKIQSLVLHNEFSKIDPSKPFMPFGQLPLIGSPFYIGSNEIFFKSVKTLNIDIDWHGAPESFKDHYANYIYSKTTSGVINDYDPAFENKVIKADFRVLDKSKWVNGSSAPSDVFVTVSDSETNDNNQLFSTSDAQKHVQLQFKNLLRTRANSRDVFNEQIQGSTRGFLRLTL